MKATKKSPQAPTPTATAAGTLADFRDTAALLAACDQALSGIAIIRGNDGTILYANEHLEQQWGGRQLVGLPMQEAWPELEAFGYFDFIRQVYDTGQPVRYTAFPGFIDRRPSGNLDKAFFNVSVNPYRDTLGAMQGVILHMTETHAPALSDGELLFQEMADGAPALIWMADADRNSYYFNKAWLDFTGRTLEQEQGTGWMEGIHPDDFARCDATIATAHQACQPFRIEYRLRRHDGNYHWIIDSGVPRFASNDTCQGYIGLGIDIHEIKRGRELERMNTLLKKQRAQLVTLNNAKDEFISIASHQLRTPASAVKQYLGLLQQGYVGELTDMQLKMIRAAYDSNQRQLGIIEALLRVAQVDAGKITPSKRTCDIVQLLEDVIEEQQAKFKFRNQGLEYQHPKVSVIASVDQRLLRMVLDNLIDNASKYSEDGTTITVTISQQNNLVTMCVADQGVGISPKDQKKLFQKFSRLANPLSSLVSGSGLGLYWAKKIIDLHGGTIEVESKEGDGSKFIITLPLQ